ncbi:hypothetical protein PR202_gb29771 [Eleusine coracana subsp. coracana]|uniref:non-specific serine/threonine protein kinase n=1 Tax=Eleusine coracana subsp. coracana TaxID=191504 RepID=A0AAV5FZQ5_ELECO|nr:hypothetical protein PR202_gb29771 [Eleusine coracana subsp. coracana]
MPGYLVKLVDGRNYRTWAFGVRTHLSAHGLWEYITGKSACPPAPVPPPQSPPGAKEVPDAASKASKDYQQALDAYNQWRTYDARAMFVLLNTVDDRIICSLPTESAQKMWTYLQKRYKPIVEAVRYTSLQKLQALRQNDESIEDFFDHFMDLWSNIEFSGTLSDDCGVCTCCRKLKEHNDKRCLYEFLICLRPEFATSKDLLLFRDPQPTVFEALGDLRVAEIRLQLQSMSKPSTAVIQCNHCRNFGHTYQKCTMRKNRRGRQFFYHGRKAADTSELQTRAQYFFSLKEIESATQHFDPANKIGEGGFGPVYKGTLADGTTVAVKKLSSKSTQGNRRAEHRLKLDWPTRYNICLGTAEGLAYLHEESTLKIVHRDIKPSNILLDEKLQPKISDFGLAKLNDDCGRVSTRIAGTIGYMAPEYATRGC